MENKYEKILAGLPEQLKYEPSVVNGEKIKIGPQTIFVLGGMGGSHLAASLLKDQESLTDLVIHSDYGLPELAAEQMERAVFAAVSHSGNTAETLDFAAAALKSNRPLAVITTGGRLKSLAEEKGLPRVIFPLEEVPRLATGYMAACLLKIMNREDIACRLAEVGKVLADSTIISEMEGEAGRIAENLGSAHHSMPLIYSSRANRALALYLKIALNETAKVPAFLNSYPELNHNELAGFSGERSADHFHLISIEDGSDDPRIVERMHITETILKEKGGKTMRIKLQGKDRAEKFWRFAALSARISFALASERGVDPVDTGFIEDFKSRLTVK